MSELLEDPLFNITIIVGLIFFLAGFMMYKFPPKKINYLYGYRTVQSMKSQERWEFAQKYSAKEMMKLGLLLAAFCLLAEISNFDNDVNLIIGLSLMILIVVILFVRVEKAIKARFDDEKR